MRQNRQNSVTEKHRIKKRKTRNNKLNKSTEIIDVELQQIAGTYNSSTLQLSNPNRSEVKLHL